mmetsp:Transcript_16175/g.52716  ORF Transcript_16175/g.52716 Transcript_16175/m.52716 type:complete len:109 (-) Transcript_16175:36-362(-)
MQPLETAGQAECHNIRPVLRPPHSKRTRRLQQQDPTTYCAVGLPALYVVCQFTSNVGRTATPHLQSTPHLEDSDEKCNSLHPSLSTHSGLQPTPRSPLAPSSLHHDRR